MEYKDKITVSTLFPYLMLKSQSECKWTCFAVDLYKLYSKVRHLGGFDAVTASRLWKYVYEVMGGDQSSTSAATCCRRHYERYNQYSFCVFLVVSPWSSFKVMIRSIKRKAENFECTSHENIVFLMFISKELFCDNKSHLRDANIIYFSPIIIFGFVP